MKLFYMKNLQDCKATLRSHDASHDADATDKFLDVIIPCVGRVQVEVTKVTDDNNLKMVAKRRENVLFSHFKFRFRKVIRNNAYF